MAIRQWGQRSEWNSEQSDLLMKVARGASVFVWIINVMCCLCSSQALITLMFVPLCVIMDPISPVHVRMPGEITSMCDLQPTSTRSVSLFVSVTCWTPPCSFSYKTAALVAAQGGLLASAWGDINVSLGKTFVASTFNAGFCKPPYETTKKWHLLRNPWICWCPSSKGNAWVSLNLLFTCKPHKAEVSIN